MEQVLAEFANHDRQVNYASAINNPRFEVLPATGHMPQMETPDLVLQTIIRRRVVLRA